MTEMGDLRQKDMHHFKKKREVLVDILSMKMCLNSRMFCYDDLPQ